MSENGAENTKGRRKTSNVYVVMKDGHVHVLKGITALNRILKTLDPDQIKVIIKGRALRLVPQTKMTVRL